MTTQAVPSRAAAQSAEAAARAAASRASVELRCLDELESLREAAALLCRTWSRPLDDPPVNPDVLRALAHAGNYVAGAFRDGTIVGASVGFLGRHDGSFHLHSHITGVLPGVESRGVGFALKQHQRAWAIHAGIETVTWTFDPLVRRNAYFNLVKLGGEIVAYHPHFYGVMDDAFNSGDETDRALVRWSLTSDRAVAAAHGREPGLDDEALLGLGASVLLEADEGGHPVVAKPDGSGLARAWVPDDVVALRRTDPHLALEWRRALRDSVGVAVGDGFVADGMSRGGWYLLRPPPDPAPRQGVRA